MLSMQAALVIPTRTGTRFAVHRHESRTTSSCSSRLRLAPSPVVPSTKKGMHAAGDRAIDQTFEASDIQRVLTG